MRHSKITHFLLLLEEQEWPQFRDFLASPYFNKSSEALQLYELLHTHILVQTDQNLSEEAAAAAIWPGEEFPRIRFRKLKSRLLDLLLRFLGQEALELYPGKAEIALLRTLNDRGEARFFHQTHKSAVSTQQNTREQNTFQFRNLYEISREFARHSLSQNARVGNMHLHESLLALEKSYRLEKLVLAHAMKELERVTGEKREIEGIEEIMEWVIAQKDIEPIFPIMVSLYKMASQFEVNENFFLLKSLLAEHSATFSKTQAMDMYIGALNFCSRKIHLGEDTWLVEQLNLYQTLLSKELILEKGMINPIFFKNVMVSGALNEAWDWMADFLLDFQKKITDDPHHNALNYGKALVAFGRSDWEATEKHLHLILQQVDDHFFGLDARNLLLKVYYESQNPIGMDSQLNSFRVYLDRNQKISKDHKAHYYSFIRFFRRLINTPPRHQKRLLNLKESIKSGKVSDRKWLHEKIDVLLGTRILDPFSS